jgi:hypothetical protein
VASRACGWAWASRLKDVVEGPMVEVALEVEAPSRPTSEWCVAEGRDQERAGVGAGRLG